MSEPRPKRWPKILLAAVVLLVVLVAVWGVGGGTAQFGTSGLA